VISTILRYIVIKKCTTCKYLRGDVDVKRAKWITTTIGINHILSRGKFNTNSKACLENIKNKCLQKLLNVKR
jgi:hypothetical protein